jgi:hypothetical protein
LSRLSLAGPRGLPFSNYARRKFPLTEAPGISVDAQTTFHRYWCYARGLSAVNGAY